MKKVFAVLLVLCLALSAFAGCQPKEQEEQPAANTDAKATEAPTSEASESEPVIENFNQEGFPIVNDKINLSLMLMRTEQNGPAEEMWFFKHMEEMTNIHFDIDEVEKTAVKEKKNLLFATGEIPDVLFKMGISKDSEVLYGGQGMFMPLNDLIDTYCPVLSGEMEKDERIRPAITTPDGNIYSFPCLRAHTVDMTVRPWINTTWLKNLGLDYPETLDDLYNVLVAFRDQDPNGNGEKDEIGIGGVYKTAYDEAMFITSALGLPASRNTQFFCMIDDEVVYAPAHPLWKEYLAYMKKLYDEGLIDKEYFTQTQTQFRAKGTDYIYGMFMDATPKLTCPVNEGQDYSAFIPLTSEFNDKRMWPSNKILRTGTTVISSQCEHPEAVARWVDYLYTEQGSIDVYFGPKDGTPEALGFTGYLELEDGTFDRAKPEGYNSAYVYECEKLVPRSGDTTPGLDPAYGYFPTAIDPSLTNPWKPSMIERLAPHYVEGLPAAYMTAEEVERSKEIKTDIEEYVNQMEAKFITGVVPMEKIDEYYETLKKLNVDEYVELYQSVCDRYYSNNK